MWEPCLWFSDLKAHNLHVVVVFVSMDSDFVSPESTVTTLLSSSGHLKSSLLPPELNTSFRYRDQVHFFYWGSFSTAVTPFHILNSRFLMEVLQKMRVAVISMGGICYNSICFYFCVSMLQIKSPPVSPFRLKHPKPCESKSPLCLAFFMLYVFQVSQHSVQCCETC